MSDLLSAQIDPKSISSRVGVLLCILYNVEKIIDKSNMMQMKLGSSGVNKKRNWDFINTPKTKIIKNSYVR